LKGRQEFIPEKQKKAELSLGQVQQGGMKKREILIVASRNYLAAKSGFLKL